MTPPTRPGASTSRKTPKSTVPRKLFQMKPMETPPATGTLVSMEEQPHDTSNGLNTKDKPPDAEVVMGGM